MCALLTFLFRESYQHCQYTLLAHSKGSFRVKDNTSEESFANETSLRENIKNS